MVRRAVENSPAIWLLPFGLVAVRCLEDRHDNVDEVFLQHARPSAWRLEAPSAADMYALTRQKPERRSGLAYRKRRSYA